MQTNSALSEIRASADYIAGRLGVVPKIAVILGSGLGGLTRQMEHTTEIPYAQIPGFPQSTVASHAGKLVAGTLGGRELIVFSGRFHYYEGYSMRRTAYPVWVMRLLGVETLILTNAAGGVNGQFQTGDFMAVTDHIKLCAESPLRGEDPSDGANGNAFGSRFADMTHAYDKKLLETALAAAKACAVPLKTGVYAYMAGPQFETPAEIRALRLLGADAVGMSTVAETIAAAQVGIRVLAVSLIANMAAGMQETLTDDEVVDTASRRSPDFVLLLSEIIKRL